MKKFLAVLCVAALLAGASAPALAELEADTPGPSDSAVVFDVVLARPMGLVSIVLGTGLFIVGLPFTIPTGSVGTSASKLIADPVRFTFVRPIGETPN